MLIMQKTDDSWITAEQHIIHKWKANMPMRCSFLRKLAYYFLHAPAAFILSFPSVAFVIGQK